MSAFLVKYVRLFTIALGFLSSVGGTLGSFFLIEGLSGGVKELSNQKAAAVREIDKLSGLAQEYFIANQQGDLIYMLGLQDNSRKDIAQLIYQGNVLDRAEPVRNVIGALAIARILDYKQTYSAYEKLSDQARQSREFGPFLAVKKFEREVVTQAQSRVGSLQLSLIPLEQQINQLESQLNRRQRLMLAFSLLGACLFLAANLIEHKSKSV
jgi:hypothetical protein